MRALRKQLLAELNSGDFFREWEAWKTIDSGIAGNWWLFLIHRFWDLGDFDVLLEPLWKRILREYADALWHFRLLLYGCELVTLIIILISLI